MGESYAAAISKNAPKNGGELLRARAHQGERISRHLADWLKDYSQLQSKQSAEIERFLGKHVVNDEQLGTLAEPWQKIVLILIEQSRLANDSSKRTLLEVEKSLRDATANYEYRAESLLQPYHDHSTLPSETVDRVQELDEIRLNGAKSALARFTTIEVDRAQALTKVSERAMQAWLSFDAQDDIAAFVAQIVSGVAPLRSSKSSSSSGGTGAASRQASQASQGSQSTVRRKSSLLMGSKDENHGSKSPGGGLRSKVGSIFGRKKNKAASSGASAHSGTARSGSLPPIDASEERPSGLSQRKPSQLSVRSRTSSVASSLRQPRTRENADDEIYGSNSPTRPNPSQPITPLTPTKVHSSTGLNGGNSPRRSQSPVRASQPPPPRSSSPVRQEVGANPFPTSSSQGVSPSGPPSTTVPPSGSAHGSGASPFTSAGIVGSAGAAGAAGAAGTANFTPSAVSSPGVMSPLSPGNAQGEYFQQHSGATASKAFDQQPMLQSSSQQPTPKEQSPEQPLPNPLEPVQQELFPVQHRQSQQFPQPPHPQQSQQPQQPQYPQQDTFNYGAVSAPPFNSGSHGAAPAPPPARHSVYRQGSLNRSASAASARNAQRSNSYGARESRVGSQVFSELPPTQTNEQADTVAPLPEIPATPQHHNGVLSAQDAGSASPEQFYTPAQKFTPHFEHANSSVASISNQNTSKFPPLPNAEGLVASAIEHIYAKYTGDELVSSGVEGEAIAQIRGQSHDVTDDHIVLGILLADGNARLTPSSFLRQTSSLSFEVPYASYLAQQELVQYHSDTAIGRVPLKITPQWRFDAKTVRLVLSLQLSELYVGGDPVEIEDLVIAVTLGTSPSSPGAPRAQSAQSKPVATFSREKQRVTWRFNTPQVLSHGGPATKLLCQFVTDGPVSTPGSIELKARVPQVSNSLLQLRTLSASGEWVSVPTSVSSDVHQQSGNNA